MRQAILALGRQDVDPEDLVPPTGVTVLGASSDHLVVDLAHHDGAVGDELAFGVGYSALLRASTSPFVSVTSTRAPPAPAVTIGGSPSSVRQEGAAGGARSSRTTKDVHA